MNMVFCPWPSCNFLFTQILFNVFDFKKNYNFLLNIPQIIIFILDLLFVDLINGVLIISSNFVADVFKLCCWCLVLKLIFFFIVVVFAIRWRESAMDLHVFPIPIPPPTSHSTRSLWVFPVHQPGALVSCIQPGLVICETDFYCWFYIWKSCARFGSTYTKIYLKILSNFY